MPLYRSIPPARMPASVTVVPTRDTARAMSQENVEVVALWIRRLSERGEPPRELCDDEIEIRNVAGLPLPGPYRGYDGARQWASDIFEVIEGSRVELEESIEANDGETVVTMQRLLGRARHSQIEIDYPWAAVWAVRDGLILRAQGYATWTEALEAAGLSE
jgi:ketosteroid isomerase-like protein